MGLRFRKSINLGGGFRINLSKSGIGYSWGVKGFRVTKTAKGQIRKTYSIPGTGISYEETLPKSSNYHRTPSTNPQTLTIGETTYYKSEHLDEISKDDIVLDRIRTIHILNYISNILCFLIVTLPIGVVIKLIIAFFGKIDLHYEFDSYFEEKYSILNSIVTEMKKNKKIWRINTSVCNASLKYSSGAAHSVTRKIINILKGMPWYIKSNIETYYIADGKKKIYLTPDRIIILDGFKVFGCKYNNLDFNTYNSKFIEEELVPKDATVISYTWKYVNKNGGPDRRFNNNRKLPICDYGGLSVTSNEGINFKIDCSNIQIMSKVTELLTDFVDIINKENNSEVAYYNFEEAYNDTLEELKEQDNITDTASQSQDNNELNFEKNTNNQNIKKPNIHDLINVLKKIFRICLLSFELFMAFAFCLVSFTEEGMVLAGIAWFIFACMAILAFKKRKWSYRITTIVMSFIAFIVFIIFVPKEYDGIYKSSSNVQVTLYRNQAEIKLENGNTLNGHITYISDNEQMIVKVNIDNSTRTYNYIFDQENKVLSESGIIYYKIEN